MTTTTIMNTELVRAQMLAACKGVYYGYSTETIRAYIRRMAVSQGWIEASDADMPTDAGTPFEGTGIIPGQDIKGMSFEKAVKLINLRRYASFPIDAQQKPSAEQQEAEFVALMRGDVHFREHCRQVFKELSFYRIN